MSDLERYFALVRERPDLFANPPGAEISILLDKDEIRAAEAMMGEYYASRQQPTEWAEVGVLYRDRYLLLLRDAVRFANGTPGTYIRIIDESGTAGVIILPVYEGKVLLTRHFRHATRRWHLEIPRGFGEQGLSSEENARRELEEETGAIIARLVSLGRAYPNTGITSECDDFYYAEITSYGLPDRQEGISELITVTVPEVEALIRDNVIDDEFTIVAYTRAKLQGLL
jgi:ADP-ribose pyrophosphatase